MAEQTVVEETPQLGSRKDAIAAAVKSVPESEQEVATETKETVEKPAEKDEKEVQDPLEAEEALKLFRALKNPETAPSVIKFIAEHAGYEKKDIQTKADAIEAKEDLLTDLKKSLGAEFEFLADKFAPAIETHLNRLLKQSQADIRQQLETQEREKLEEQSARTITKLSTDFFGEDAALPENVQAEMSKFMDRFPPSADVSLKEYLGDAFTFATGKLGLSKVDKSKQERSNKNRSDAPSRLASDRTVRTSQAVPDTSHIKTRKEAIQAAIESLKDK